MIHRRAAEYRFALTGAIRGEAEGAAEEEYWHAVARLEVLARRSQARFDRMHAEWDGIAGRLRVAFDRMCRDLACATLLPPPIVEGSSHDPGPTS